ncbi:MAG: hypothetical protein NTU49_09100 [Gammaproteobacteria bacterium]|nr:hypothetical protein [Gammaproteobacteria bacterium]
MKKIVSSFVLFSAAFVISNAIFAASAPFSTGPAVPQDYHSVSDNTASPIAPVAVAAAAPAVATVPAIADATDGAAVINPLPVTPAATDTDNAFQQQANQRLLNLENSDRAMAGAIQTINQNIAVMQQQMMQKSTHPSASSSNVWHSWFAWMSQAGTDGYLNFAAVAVILLGSGMAIGGLMRRNPRVVSVKNTDDTKDEYDFMATAEAIPAKIDLARSYMTMGNYEDARVELKIVMQKGNEEQRMVAESLIHKINKIRIGVEA